MYKKVLAVLLAMAMVLSSAMVMMAGEPAEGEPDEAEIKATLESILGEVTDTEGSFEPGTIMKLIGSLYGAYDADAEGQYDDLQQKYDTPIDFFTQVEEAIDQHLLDETAEDLETGDETLFSHVIVSLDIDEEETIHMIGYFTIMNFDAEEDCPGDLVMKNGAGLTELLTLTQNEDGSYEVTECVTAEDGEGYADSVAVMCEDMDLDPDVFYEALGLNDLTYVVDLYDFMEAHPEYDHIEYMGEMLTPDDLDATADELFKTYLALYAVDNVLTSAGHDDTTSVDTKTFQLGTSSYTLEIPESYVEGERSEEDVRNYMVAYMSSPESEMDFDVYQYGKEGLPEDLAELAVKEAELYETTDIKTDVDVNGINAARCEAVEPFEGKDYDTITYFLDDGDTYVEVVFWMGDDTSEAQAEEIFSTLSYAAEATAFETEDTYEGLDTEGEALDFAEAGDDTAFSLEDIIKSINESDYDILGLFDQIADLVEIFMNDGETETVGNIIRAVGDLVNTIIKGDDASRAGSELVRNLALEEDSLSRLSSGTVLDIYEATRDELIQRGIIVAE